MDSLELFLTRDVKDPQLIERCKANMDNPSKHPSIDNDLTKDQMAEQGIPVESCPTKVDQVNKELAEEAGQKDASWKSAPVPESERQGEDNNYFDGISQ